MELGGQTGKFSNPTTASTADPQQEERYLARPTEKKPRIHLSPGGRKIVSCATTTQPMRDCHNLTNERLLHLELCIYYKGLLSITAPPNKFSPFLYKTMFLSFVLQTCLWFYTHILNCNSYSQINSFLLVK